MPSSKINVPSAARTIQIAPVLAAVCLLAAVPAFGAGDGIFPATTPEAAKAIHWSGDGFFVVKGQPTFLSSGEIHYARVPRELWKDRILRAKAMGLNTIQTYVMWNAHEGTEGHFDFTGSLDLDAWLTTIQECGMYATVRVGPYICGEWENGGLPAWLCDKPGMKVRVNDPQYLSYVDKFESKVFDIIAKHQIQKGGNLLMAQLENEYPNRWGTDTDAYLDHLRELARAHGLEIPLFNSGLHHGDDPAGDRPFGNRTTPWFSTEFWIGWIGLEGDMNAQKAEQKVRGTWKIIGFGGAGYDYYVVHGGSDFGYSKGAEVTASYDYAAPIGEAGQLRKVYFPLKRAAMFAQAFSDVLATSKDGGRLIASNTASVQTFARTSSNGTAIFLADAARFQGGGRGRRGGQAVPAPQTPQTILTQIKLADGRQIPSGTNTLALTPGEIRPILTDFVVPQDVKGRPSLPVIIDYAATAILTRIQLGDTTYLVCHGAPGDVGEVKVKDQAQLLSFTYPQGDAITTVNVPNGSVKLLVMNTDLADRTWIVGKGNAQSLVIGPQYASPEGELEVPTKSAKVIVYSAAGRKELNTPQHDAATVMPALKWSEREGALEAANDDSKWAASPEPKPMEQYEDYPNGWGWYRTTIHRDAPGDVQLKFTAAGDVLRLFVNGHRVAGAKNGATLSLQAGDNELAVLCWNEGRPKMYNFTGPTGLTVAKGIWGPVTLTGGSGDTATKSAQEGWHFHPGLSTLQETPLLASVTNWKKFLDGKGLAGWMNEPNRPIAPNTPLFFRADFKLAADAKLHQPLSLRTTGLKSGSVWINGHNLGPYKNTGNRPTEMYVPECWLKSEANTMVIFDAEGAAPTQAALHPLETWVKMQLSK
jgi:beta-galactosidase